MPVAFAVNRDYARADSVLSDGDEVAFIPPISGGSGAQDLYRFDLTEGELDPRALEQECRTDRDGAVVTFAGTTRDHNEGAQVLSLSYEAYTEMAQRVMCVLFEEAVKRFPITRARVAHRVDIDGAGPDTSSVVELAPLRVRAHDDGERWAAGV